MSLCNYSIFIDGGLGKYIAKNLPEEIKQVFDDKMKYFSNNPHHPSLNTKKYNANPKTLRRLGVDEIWEFYINRKTYRCVFYVVHSEKQIIIAFVGNHQQTKNKFT